MLIIEGILLGVATAAVVAIIGLSFRGIRRRLFYKAEEYKIEYDKSFGAFKWEIRGKGVWLTVEAAEVSRSSLEEVTVKVDRENVQIGDMTAGGDFQQTRNPHVELRVVTIERMSPSKGNKQYNIRLEVRRRRW